MVDKALVQERQVFVDARVKLLIISRIGKMDAREEFVEFALGAMPGKDVFEEADGVDAPHQVVRVRHLYGRIVVVLAHDGEVHGLGIGNAHPRVHVVQQVHVKEQVPGDGRYEPEGRFLVGRFVHAGLREHVPHAVVDGVYRSGEGEGSDGARHHLAHVPLGEQVPAQVFVPVKFLYVNDFRSDGTHLQEVQRATAEGPFQVFFLPKAGADFFACFVQLPYFFLRE